ncbi:peritrophin-44-like [Bradysia coprophila]|uniref:peritrophin-44-like n=1 Tax=Bradysia coprophila TaxID=38358 RepID=UPI00187DA67B|nr:peritrophin-44-like [Bradysia coprophila]
MSSSVLFLCLFLLIRNTYQTSTINGTIVKTVLCNESGVRCTDDCSTLLVCGKDEITPLRTVFCPDTSLDTPYCTKNACSSSTIGTCSAKVTSIFKCTESGIFPDPDDCTRYRQCNDVGITADYYQCPVGYNYNSLIGLCDKTAVCDTIDCSGSKVEAVTFKLNPRFYAFCYTTATARRIRSPIYQCNANLMFSTKANTCVYQCASAGVFKDLTNCHAFFSCSGSVSNLKWVRKVCPTNFFFDGTECVVEKSPCSAVSTPSVVEDSSTNSNDTTDATYL